MMYTLLLAEDEYSVRKAIINTINWEELGFQIIGEAENGLEALEIVEQYNPDVIITDIRMPFMGGIDLAKLVREINPITKIVFLTGFNDFDYAISAIKLNVIEYLSKPVTAKKMKETLTSIKIKLDEENSRLRNIELLRKSYTESLPIVRIGLFFYKELTMKDIIMALKKTLISSSSIMLIIGFTTIFTWLLTMANIPNMIASFFLALNMPKLGYVLLFDVLILLIGTFVDVTPAILLLCPILLPVMQSVGVSELQFGAMVITGLAIGLVTPPIGMCLNACNKINKMPIIDIFKGALPFILCNVTVLILISVFPALTTWLPSCMSY